MTKLKFISKANYSTPKSDSLRVTIPKEIVEELNLSKGDSIKWIVDKEETTGQVKFIKIEKLEL